MSTYYANDKYNAVLTAGYSFGQTTLYVSAVPNHVPTIIVAAKGTDNETVFAVTDKTTNSLTGVSRLRGANVDLDAQTPLTCLNNEEFINQLASVSAVFNEEHDETGKHTTDQINEKTEDAGVTVDGVKHKDGQVYTDQINEKTANAGVTFKKTVQTITTATDGATVTFDLAKGNIHTVTLGGNRTLALSHPTVGQCFIISLKQDSTGNRTVTWFSTIKWTSGSAPTLTTAANKTDTFGFICTASGQYDGYIVGIGL